jgi:micrococcal nuclease
MKKHADIVIAVIVTVLLELGLYLLFRAPPVFEAAPENSRQIAAGTEELVAATELTAEGAGDSASVQKAVEGVVVPPVLQSAGPGQNPGMRSSFGVQNQQPGIPLSSAGQPGQVASRQSYPVAKVVDGNTIDVLIGGVKERIRLIGVNTPETVDPRKPVQCYGPEASAAAKAKLTSASVFLESDSSQDDKDKYDRLLRYVFLADGTDFDEWLIENGYGFEYTYKTPYKYQAQFKAAQQRAKQNGIGLWAVATCDGQLKAL